MTQRSESLLFLVLSCEGKTRSFCLAVNRRGAAFWGYLDRLKLSLDPTATSKAFLRFSIRDRSDLIPFLWK
jgi:hypothetical protein